VTDGTAAEGGTELLQAVTDQLAAEQAPTGRAPREHATAHGSGQLWAAYSAIQTVWEQHWNTVSDLDHGALAGYGAAAELQASKVAVWEAAMADCRQALQQLQEAKRVQHEQCTPEQILSQYHPSSALEFRLQVCGTATAEGLADEKGLAEKAQTEVEARLCTSEQDFIRSSHWGGGRELSQCMRNNSSYRQLIDCNREWVDRARRTADMAQQFEQAATESMGSLEAALCTQDWDHRKVSKRHDDELRKLESKETDLTHSGRGKQVTLEQGKLKELMSKVRAHERLHQLKESRKIYIEKCTRNRVSEEAKALDIDT
jgi:hypothetical protein